MEPLAAHRTEALKLTDDEQKLLITRGLPGSGKSSFAEVWVSLSDQHTRVSRDDLRAMLFNESGVLTADKEATVSAVERAQVRALIKQGKSVIVDATHLKAQYGRVWAEIAKERGIRFEVVDFHTPVDEAVERDRIRGLAGERSVGEEVIRKLDKRFRSRPQIKARDTAPGPMEPYVADERKLDAYIFDIDGTLAHHDGLRSPYDYDSVDLDVVDEAVRTVLKQLYFDSSKEIIIVSGRDDSCYGMTSKWLTDNDIPFDKLLMRAADDKRPDFQVKYDIFDQEIRNNYNVLGVFDDRAQVVRMWRELGLKCFQVADGNF